MRKYEDRCKALPLLWGSDYGRPGTLPELPCVSVGGRVMKDNIMYSPSIILMVVEAVAFAFLVWAWFDAKGRAKDG